jgi:hypothetical protein
LRKGYFPYHDHRKVRTIVIVQRYHNDEGGGGTTLSNQVNRVGFPILLQMHLYGEIHNHQVQH